MNNDSQIRPKKRDSSPLTYTITEENSKIERTCSSCPCHSRDKNRNSQKCSRINTEQSQSHFTTPLLTETLPNEIEIKEDYNIDSEYPDYDSSDPTKLTQQYKKTLNQKKYPENYLNNSNYSQEKYSPQKTVNLKTINQGYKNHQPIDNKNEQYENNKQKYSYPKNKNLNIEIPQKDDLSSSDYVPTYNYIEDLKNLNINLPEDTPDTTSNYNVTKENSFKETLHNYVTGTFKTEENNNDDTMNYYPLINNTLNNENSNNKQDYYNKFCPNRNLYRPSSFQKIQNSLPNMQNSYPSNYLSTKFLIPKKINQKQNLNYTFNGSTLPTENTSNLKHINNILGNEFVGKLAQKKMNNFNPKYNQLKSMPNYLPSQSSNISQGYLASQDTTYNNTEMIPMIYTSSEENSQLNFKYKDLNSKLRNLNKNKPKTEYYESENYSYEQPNKNNYQNMSSNLKEEEQENIQEFDEENYEEIPQKRNNLRGKNKIKNLQKSSDEPIGKEELQKMAEKYDKMDIDNIDIDNLLKEDNLITDENLPDEQNLQTSENLPTNGSLANKLRNRKMKEESQNKNDYDEKLNEKYQKMPETKEELKKFNEYLIDENDVVKRMNFTYKQLLDTTFYFFNSLSSKHKFNGDKQNDIFKINDFMKNPDDLTNLLIELEKCTAGEKFIKPKKLLKKKENIQELNSEEEDEDELKEIHEYDFSILPDHYYNDKDIFNPNHPLNLVGKDEDLLLQSKDNFSFGQNSLGRKNKDYNGEKPSCVACLLGCGNSVRGYSPMNYNPYQKYPKVDSDNNEKIMKKQKSAQSIKSSKSNSSYERGKMKKRNYK